ncbi:MAG: peptide ABC transporter permease [Actinobacteria bacterium 13_2_20CM_2_71_6]|nr:MAG: peptide ABC transporter permease [Actinobacteria bacterium 13_2_20CM_2_71_6]
MRRSGMGGDAWRVLRRKPVFWVSIGIIVLVAAMAALPMVFTHADPLDCPLDRSMRQPSGSAWFGYDFQGCDVFARTVHGARSSILVGVLATLLAAVIAFAVGMSAGYFGGWLDALLSRLTDIVLGIPLLLAAIVLLHRATANGSRGVWPVVGTLGILGWTTAARVVRSSVLAARHQDYVVAARMLGAGHRRILFRHILPNAIAPAVVVLTITLGTFIAAEATLSFLGIGLRAPTISWGGDIFGAQPRLRQAWWPLIWPSTFLAVTVLAFIMLGDAVRDAFDPRSR